MAEQVGARAVRLAAQFRGQEANPAFQELLD